MQVVVIEVMAGMKFVAVLQGELFANACGQKTELTQQNKPQAHGPKLPTYLLGMLASAGVAHAIWQQ